MSTKQSLVRVLLIGSFGVVAARAAGQESKPAAAKEAAKPRIVIADVVELKAKVDAVDQAKRLVTLTDAQGDTVTVKAGPAVKNLDQVKAGDEFVIKYFASMALFIRKAGEAASESETAAVAVAAKGQEPAAVAVDTFEYKAKVEAVHPVLRMLTLKLPDGKTKHLWIHESVKSFGDIKKGDDLVFRYTEAVAVSFEKPK